MRRGSCCLFIRWNQLPDDVNWIKARKFSLVHGGTEYVEGRKQINKSMQAELVYVREKPMSTQAEEELADGNFA